MLIGRWSRARNAAASTSHMREVVAVPASRLPTTSMESRGGPSARATSRPDGDEMPRLSYESAPADPRRKQSDALDTARNWSHRWTMGLLARRPRAPWKPTAVQKAAALKLTRTWRGRVRTFADGSAELRMLVEGGLHRYRIDAEGNATVLERRPKTDAYRWHERLFKLGWWLGVAATAGFLLVVAIFRMRGMSHEDVPPWLTSVGRVTFAGAFAGGWIIAFGSSLLVRQIKSPPGERWKTIGGADY
jgi:hypothetical protein